MISRVLGDHAYFIDLLGQLRTESPDWYERFRLACEDVSQHAGELDPSGAPIRPVDGAIGQRTLAEFLMLAEVAVPDKRDPTRAIATGSGVWQGKDASPKTIGPKPGLSGRAGVSRSTLCRDLARLTLAGVIAPPLEGHTRQPSAVARPVSDAAAAQLADPTFIGPVRHTQAPGFDHDDGTRWSYARIVLLDAPRWVWAQIRAYWAGRKAHERTHQRDPQGARLPAPPPRPAAAPTRGTPATTADIDAALMSLGLRPT